MIVEKIHMKSFGLLTDTTLNFAETINVIEGQNETGKSTIAAFIKYMLYGFDDTEKPDETGERQRRINWDTKTAEGSMTVRVRGRRYLINRATSLVEGGARPRYREDCSIIDMESGTPAFGKSPAGEIFFGVSRELFENTAFIGTVRQTDIERDTVTQSIENILFSGNEKINLQKATARIDDKMESLLHTSGGGGVIFDLMKKQEDLEEKLRQTNEDNHRILAKEAELHEIRGVRKEAENKLERAQEMDGNYKNLMLIQTFDKLHELEKACEEKGAALNAFLEENTRNHFVPTQQYLTDLAVARRTNTDAYRAMNEAEERYNVARGAVGITNEIAGAIRHADSLGGEQALTRQAGELRAAKIRGFALAVACSLLLVAAAVYEIAATGALASVVLRCAVGLIGLAAVVLGILLVLDARRKGDSLHKLCRDFATELYEELIGKLQVIAQAREKRDRQDTAVSETKAAAQSAKEAYENSRKELLSVIMRWGQDPPTEGLNAYLDRLESKVGAFLEQLETLQNEKKNLEMTVKELRRTLSDKSEIDIRAQLSPLKRKSMGDVHHDEIAGSIQECRARIAEQDRLAFEVENELSALKMRARDPGELITKIRLLSEQIEKLRRMHKAYFLAGRTIADASANLRAEISPRLGTYATSLMEIMTDKKYTGVSVSDGLRVTYTDLTGEERTADFLSGGTRDLTYIAVRMALIDMLYTERPPVIFDESFAHQDNLRAKSMMAGIAYLSEKEAQQSFIFTCRSREAAMANEAVKGAGIFRLSLPAGE